MPNTRDVLERSNRTHHLRGDTIGDKTAKPLPKLKSFADLKVIKEKLTNEEGQTQVREALRQNPLPDGAGNTHRSLRGDSGGNREGLREINGQRELVSSRQSASPTGRLGQATRHAIPGSIDHERNAGAASPSGTAGGGDQRSNVQGPDLTQHNVPYYVHRKLANMTVGSEFTSSELSASMGLPGVKDVATALSRCQRLGVLEVIGKEGRFYLYRLINPDLDVMRGTHPIETPVIGRKVTHRVRSGKVNRVDVGLGLTYQHKQHEKREAPPLLEVDYSAIEERALAHLTGTIEALPDTLRRIGAAVHHSRRVLLEGFTTSELLSEVARRVKAK